MHNSADHNTNSPLVDLATLNNEDIVLNCGSRSSERGKAYQKQGRVNDLQWKPDFQMIHARVHGSGNNHYRQHIDMTSFERFGDIDGECSCPVSFNCKHVAAVLYQCQQQQKLTAPETAPEANLDNWQATMQALQQQAISTAGQYEDLPEQIIYTLSPANDKGCTLTLNVQRRRRLKAGGWGKANHVKIENLTSIYRRPAYANEQDQHIATLMERYYSGSHYNPNYRDYVITGAEGAILLKQLIKTGRCYWQDLLQTAQQTQNTSTKNPRPLSLASPKQASFNWQQSEQQYQLAITLADINNHWQCIATDPPYYFDSANMQVGEIRQSFSTDAFLHLQSLPALTENEAEKFSRFLLHEVANNDLPTPVKLNIQHAEAKPVPQATLITEQRHGKTLNYLRLQFAYGDCLLQPLQQELSELPNRQIKDELFTDDNHQEWLIHRQPEQEAAFMQMLRDRNLLPMPREDDQPFYLDWFFMPLSSTENARQWQALLRDGLEELEQLGWQITHDPGFNLQFNQAMDFSGSLSGSGDWFSIGLDVKIGRQKVALLPLVLQWISENTLRQQQEILVEHKPNQWMTIPRHVIQPIVDTLVELHGPNTLDKNGTLQLPRSHASRVLNLQESLQEGLQASSQAQLQSFSWNGGKRIQELAKKLQQFDGIKTVAPPNGLKAELRDYQQQGLNWLGFLTEFQFGGILADDMGLGKTLQTLAHILSQKQLRKLKQPVLVVAPTSLLSNWAREAARFTPQLKVLVSHGSERFALHDSWDKHDIIITSYALLSRDQEQINAQQWHSLILDEAQMIKNANSQTAQVARSIRAKNRLCLTGTPMENHLGELWSLFHFLMPDFLGSQARFNVVFRKPIENDGISERQQALSQRLKPFMLRRTKTEVAAELPPKTDIIRSIALGEKQARLYETVRITMEKKIHKLMKAKGLASSQIEMLDALLKMRQVCCDPRLLQIPSAKKVNQSAKLSLLMELLPELLEEGRRILIFSQFTSMLGLIEAELKLLNIRYSKLTGQTRKRDQAIDAFQSGEVDVFLISLKAGGVGLNLTEADTVIHYDPWWNPAAEKQATDRAHRIGQDKPVFVYKLITENTVEEKIIALQQKKQALADAVYNQGKKENKQGLQSEELLALFEAI